MPAGAARQSTTDVYPSQSRAWKSRVKVLADPGSSEDPRPGSWRVSSRCVPTWRKG